MYDDPAEIRNALLDLVPAIARKYGNLGSVAAAEWYDRMRAKWFKDDGYAADSTYDPDDVPMRKTVRRLAGNLWDKDENTPANPDLMLSGLHAAMDRWVKAGGRETITRAVKKDPSKPRFARVPQGPTCGFCMMLASRGFVYSSAEAAAGAMNQYHHDCDCVPVPSWDRKNPKVAGYDDKSYEKRHLEARRMLEDHTVPEELMDGLLKIKPYLEPKHKKSWYGPEDPNNVNSIAYLMRHLHPDEYSDNITLESPEFLIKDGPVKDAIGAEKAKNLEALLKSSKHQETAKIWALYSGRYAIKGTSLKIGERSHYNKAKGGIYIDLSSIGDPSRGHGPYGVFVHESTHMLDDLLGDGSSSYSSNYKGGLLSKTLSNEGTSLFYSRVESADAESYPERFPIAMKDIAEEFRRVGGDDSLNLHDMFIASLQTVDTHIADEYYENYGWAGHSGSYFAQGSQGVMQAREAFAEMVEAQLTNPKAWGLIQQYFPESSSIFNQMIKEAPTDAA